MDARRELIVERVLRAVELVPPGRVASYGTIGRICGVGARQVGQIMQRWGADVPWWRITAHGGDFRGDLLQRALPHWEREGIRLKPNRLGCRYAEYAADEAELDRRWREAVADLEPASDDGIAPR